MEKTVKIHDLSLSYQSWGDEENPDKLLCLHGWLDNSNSFLPMSPFLKDRFHVLAVDMPGHGKSQHLDSSAHYHFLDSLFWIEELRREWEFDSINFLCHSLGGVLAGMYAGVFPHRVANLFAIEALGPITNPAEKTCENLRTYIDRAIQLKTKKKRLHPNKNSCVDARVKAGEISREAAKILVDRGAEGVQGSFQWRSDPRLTLPTNLRLTEPQAKNVMEAIECPYHLIVADQGFSLLEKVLSFRKDYLSNLTIHRVSGNHHVHMDSPEEIANIVISHFS